MENSEFGFKSSSDIIASDSGKKINNDHSQENFKQMDFDLGFEHVDNDNTFFQNDQYQGSTAASAAAPVVAASVTVVEETVFAPSAPVTTINTTTITSLIDVDSSLSNFMDLPKPMAQNITTITKDFLSSEQSSSPDDSPVHYASPRDAPPPPQPAAAAIDDSVKTTNSSASLIDQIEDDYLNPYSTPKHLVESNEKFISSEDLNTNYKDIPSEPIKTSVLDDDDDYDFMASSGQSAKASANLVETTDLDYDLKNAGDTFEQVSEPYPAEPIITMPKPSYTEPSVPAKPKVVEQSAPAQSPPPAAAAPAPPKKETVEVSPSSASSSAQETSQPQKEQLIAAEKMFKQIGLDAWFKPERLHPRVESLIYWRDVKKSALVFGVGLAVLLAMSLFSLISVFAYVSLITLFGTIAFRIYKTVLQAIQKTSEGHPFKEYLEIDLTLPQDKVQQIASIATTHVNAFAAELRRLFLVEDLIDSIKFGVLLWCLTYIGAIFNGMTCIIIAFVALFTLPKVYENNKQSIDAYIDLVRSKILEITEKVKAAVPLGKKTDSDKDK